MVYIIKKAFALFRDMNLDNSLQNGDNVIACAGYNLGYAHAIAKAWAIISFVLRAVQSLYQN